MIQNYAHELEKQYMPYLMKMMKSSGLLTVHRRSQKKLQESI